MLNIDIPQPKVFYDPLIIALAWATDFTAERFVPCDSIFASVLKLAGYNIHEIPREVLQPPHGVVKPHQNFFWCKFLLAFRYQKDSPVNGEVQIRCSPEPQKKGYWGLTKHGLDQALELELTPEQEKDCESLFEKLNSRKSTDGPSLTHQWVKNEWPKIQEVVFYRLSRLPKLAISRSIGEIEEHVSFFIENALHKDLFATYIEEGRTVTVSNLIRWIIQRANNQFRSWGSDASCIAHRGALTEAIRKDPAMAEYHCNYPRRERDKEVGITDCNDYHTSGDAGHHLAISQALDTLMNGLTGIGRTPNEVVRRVVETYCRDNHTLNECAKILDLSTNQVKKVVSEIRTVAKKKFGSSENLLTFGYAKKLGRQVGMEKSVTEVGL